MSEHPRDTPQFYLTAPSPCPYLPGREERKVFTHLVGERATALNDVLTQGGFRRSQSIAYRPACEGCRACVSVRICVDEFHESRSFRRVLKENADLVGQGRPPTPTSEQYGLFRAYVGTRHGAGGMADMSVLDYAPASPGAKAFEALTREIIAHGADNGTGNGVDGTAEVDGPAGRTGAGRRRRAG